MQRSMERQAHGCVGICVGTTGRTGVGAFTGQVARAAWLSGTVTWSCTPTSHQDSTMQWGPRVNRHTSMAFKQSPGHHNAVGPHASIATRQCANQSPGQHNAVGVHVSIATRQWHLSSGTPRVNRYASIATRQSLRVNGHASMAF